MSKFKTPQNGKKFVKCAPPTRFGWKKYALHVSSTSLKKKHKLKGTHFQCLINHYVKFEYKSMNTVGVTDYTN